MCHSRWLLWRGGCLMSHCSAAVSMSPATLYPVSRLSWVSSWSAPLHPDSVSHISVVVTSFLVMSLSAPSAICPHLGPRKTAPQCTIWDCNSSSWWLRKNTSLSFCSLRFVPHVSRVLNVDTGPAAKRSTLLGFCGDKEGRSHTVTDVGLFSSHFSDEY